MTTKTPNTPDELRHRVEDAERLRDATNPVPEDAYGSWLLVHDRAEQPEPGAGDLERSWSEVINTPDEGVVCPITGRGYHVDESTLTELWTHSASALYFVGVDQETGGRRRRLREHVIDAFLQRVGPEHVGDAVRHAAHYIASHPPDEDDAASESFGATAFEGELRALVPVAREWLSATGTDPDLLG